MTASASSRWTIVKYADDDSADLLADIHLRAFARSVQRAWSANELGSLVEDEHCLCLLAKDGEHKRAVGFILARYVLDEAEILTFAVCPDHQGRGVGSALLGRLIDKLRTYNVRQLFLEAAQDNETALGLYDKFGFERTARLEKYYGGSANAEMLDGWRFLEKSRNVRQSY